MSAELSKLRARVSALERQAIGTSARIEEVAQDVESIAGRLAEVKINRAALSQSVDHRFEYVYGELADIKANTKEIRDLLEGSIGPASGRLPLPVPRGRGAEYMRLRGEIKQFLADHPGVSIGQVATAFGKPKSTMQRWMEKVSTEL